MSPPKIFPILYHLVSANALPKITSLLEIGVCDGFFLEYLITENPDLSEFVLCDTWRDTYGGSNRGSHDHIVSLFEKLRREMTGVTFLDGDSRSLLPAYFESFPGEVFDICIVDGDHSGDGMWRDLVNTVDHANVVIVHDIRHHGYLYLKDVFYAFYETVRERFVAIDDGKDVGMLVRRDLLGFRDNGIGSKSL
jgi:hypothetical protein